MKDVTLKVKGDWKRTFKFFKSSKNFQSSTKYKSILEKYGEMGVERLKEATPKDTGKTSESWVYEIAIENGRQASIEWNNTNRNDGVPIALVIQYGHVTQSGYRIEGIDYINPALAPVFEELAEKVWKEVISL